MFSQTHLVRLSVIGTPLSSNFSSPKYKKNLTWYRSVVDFQTRDATNKKMNTGMGHVCNAISHDQEQPNEGITVPNMKVEGGSAVINEYITSIKSIFNSMEAGEISESPYDTAWVGLIRDVNDAPQFPSCLEWIANHQLEDGSWGCSSLFCVQDRIINTLACIIALKSWSVYGDKFERGVSFVKENINKLHDANVEITLNCFQIIFPALLEMAEKLDIKVIESSTLLQETYVKRNLKLENSILIMVCCTIPNEVMHNVPTTLLHCLEGMAGRLDWDRLLKLQFEDGSFLLSPSSTAFAYIQTKDENCLSYLRKIVDKFDGGVPYMYNVELFEKIWTIDRLQRLGISRHFQTEIKECLDYVYRYWNDKGLGMGRYCTVRDIDDTCMGFRLLRLHGFHVSPDVFRHFEEGDEFVCYPGQLKQGVTDTYNLFRASQLMFPDETILEKAKNFSFKFLKEKQASNQLLDKWLITKDLPGEVGYALDVPWYANLPHVETRFYIDQYGGDDDVWIGKTFYRVPCVSNNKYLELAKLEFKQCQAQHQLEWKTIQKWYTDSDFGDFGISTEELLLAYFLSAASIFEPQMSSERMAWTKTAVLIKILASYFSNEATCIKDKMTIINKLDASIKQDCVTNERNESSLIEPKKTSHGLISTLMKSIHELCVVAQGRDIHLPLYGAWKRWIKTLYEEGIGYNGEAELILHMVYHCRRGHSVLNEMFTSSDHHLLQVTNKVCNKLRRFQDQKVDEVNEADVFNISKERIMTDAQIENGMQELVQSVYQNTPDSDDDAYMKKTCLTIAKTFYYTACCNPITIHSHITKVLFKGVE